MIKMQVIGNLGKDCVVNTVMVKMLSTSLWHILKSTKTARAISRKKQPGWIAPTGPTVLLWHQYLTKGKQVFVEGQPEARSFQRNDGTPGSSLSLRVREVQLLGGKGDSAGGVLPAPYSALQLLSSQTVMFLRQ